MVELHAASAFSFLAAASTPEALVDRAAGLGYRALALLDRDGVYGAPRFHKAARAAGVAPITGCELTIGPGPAATPGARAAAAASWRLPVLVESRAGYQNLCQLITRMKLRAPKGEGQLALEELDGWTRGLVAFAGAPALSGERHGVGGLVERLIGVFGRSNVYVEIQRSRQRDEEAANHALRDLASAFRLPVVATGGVRYATPVERPLCDVLACIRYKTTLAQAGRLLSRNAERFLQPPAERAALFADAPDALAEAEALADRLVFTMEDLGYRFPEYPVPPGETPASFLRKITLVGARERYRPLHERAVRQLTRELDLIEKLDLAGYFLIVWDIVNFCRQQDVLVQGRGSAANSAVCYSLGITAVDPVGMDLLFERFLSEQRGEWPDIDLDLPSGDRRERVIQHVYRKYGSRGAAMTANVITYRERSAAREAGKTLGLAPEQIDRLSAAMHRFEFVDPDDTLGDRVREAGLDPEDARVQRFADLWRRLQDLPRHLGQHSGGMVLSQGPLDLVAPLENASMPDRVVVQWDKEDCADMGLIKVDLLGLGMMAVLQDSLVMVNRTTPLDLAHLPPDDPAVYAMLQSADTVGLFQVESRAQMATLPRLKPACFYDLVVEVAIIRPGPIVGQMVHPYLDRRAGRAPVEYPHPSLEPFLKRTLGVPLFQEQLLRIAMVAAGFTGGEAEELRRAFGFKRSERRMKQIEGRLRDGMARNGITGAAADQIILSISSFALYGFPESHAASFALIVYASAYLKAHFPAAFYTALLNNQPMGFYHPATLVKDAQRRGVRFAGVDVQRSMWDCTVTPDGAVQLGLRYVAGLRESAGRRIAERPAAPGPAPRASRCPKCGCDDPSMLEIVETRDEASTGFCNTCAHDWPVPRPAARYRSIDDLTVWAGLRRDELAMLADIGALGSFGRDRRDALWQVERAARSAGALFQEAEAAADTETPEDAEAPGARPRGPLPLMSIPERIAADYAGTGLTIGPHPMALRRGELALRGVLRASDLPRQRHGRRVRVAGAVITRQRPGTAKGFVFLTLEDETGLANVIIRPDLFAADRMLIVRTSFLLIEGVLQTQDGAISIRAERIAALEGGGPDVAARNFW
jgi:error-prone DNA polymerase